ncbi:hypothetical protein EES39_14280 [Streptomyces sp. ADI92-24]|nr:hypothetical protein EES39_14280 [Streptomyces sp. ADI92-24]
MPGHSVALPDSTGAEVTPDVAALVAAGLPRPKPKPEPEPSPEPSEG